MEKGTTWRFSTMTSYRETAWDVYNTGTSVFHNGVIAAKRKIGVQYRWDTEGNKIPLLFTPNMFKIAVNWMLFYVRGCNNISGLPEDIRNAKLSNISDDDINEFIEKQLWQSGNQKPTDVPPDILRGIKGRLVNDKILGYMGRTPGEVIRNLKFNSFNMFSPVLDFKILATDIQDEIQREYERLKEDDETIKDNDIPFEKAYPRIGLKYVDQYQTVLNQIKFGVYYPLYLSHHIPFYMPIPGLTVTDNMWINRFSEVPEIAYQQFVCDDEKLSLVITQPLMNTTADIVALTTSVLFLLLTAKITNRVAGEVIWNYGESVIQYGELDIFDELVEEFDNRKYTLKIEDHENFLDYVVDDFTLQEIE